MIKVIKIQPDLSSSTLQFLCTYRAIVELWENNEVVHATPVRNIEEMFDVIERYKKSISVYF